VPLATTQGREFALKALAERRAANLNRAGFRNDALVAGSPVYLDCIACGTLVEHPENYLVRVELCAECSALHALGWLNE
jgi:hypothetical protein